MSDISVKQKTDPTLDPVDAKKVAELRSQVRETFGKIVLGMMSTPRYRHQNLSDLQHIVLEPLLRDRVAIAYSKASEGLEQGEVAGIAIWASVSDEIDIKIREQIAAGVYPIRLKADDWTSGKINWLLDVMAPNKEVTASMVSNFAKVVKEGEIRLHPVVQRLVDPKVLQKMVAAGQKVKM